jgi:hypothetical protein
VRKNSVENIFSYLFIIILVVITIIFTYKILVDKEVVKREIQKQIQKNDEIKHLYEKRENIFICYLTEYKDENIPKFYYINDKEYPIIKIYQKNLSEYLENIMDPSNPLFFQSPIKQCSIIVVNYRNLTDQITHFVKRQSFIGKQVILKIDPEKYNETLKNEFCIVADEYIGKMESTIISGGFLQNKSGSYQIIIDDYNGHLVGVKFLREGECKDNPSPDKDEGMCLSTDGIYENYVDPNGNPHIVSYKFHDVYVYPETQKDYVVGKYYLSRGSIFKTVDKIFSTSWNTLDDKCLDKSKEVLMKIKGSNENMDHPYVVGEDRGLGRVILILTGKKSIVLISKLIIQDFIV